jgi:lysophospholipase L1-like esterase
VLLRWSLGYAAILAFLAAALLLPPLVALAARRLGSRRVAFTLLPGIALLAIAYFAASTYYYWTRTYPFDPFLQVPPPELEARPSPAGVAQFRILALGGSTTHNAKLPPQSRYPEVLERLLRERRPDLDIVVANAGMEWYTTKHSLIDYDTRLYRWRPDLVVVMHGINDLCRSCNPPEFVVAPNTAYEPDWSHYYGAAMHAAAPPSFPRFLYDLLFLEIGWKWYARWRVVERDYPVDHWLALPDYRQNLSRLAGNVRGDGHDLVLVNQASLLGEDLTPQERRVLLFGAAFCRKALDFARSEVPSPNALAAGLAAFNAATLEVGRQVGAPVVDAAAALPKDLGHFVDDVHYTAGGSEALARAVADVVETRLPPRAP